MGIVGGGLQLPMEMELHKGDFVAFLGVLFEEESDKGLMDEVLKLPEKYRIVIHLFYFEEYKVKEIAEILNTSENTVKTRLLNGRRILKDKLEGWEDE